MASRPHTPALIALGLGLGALFGLARELPPSWLAAAASRLSAQHCTLDDVTGGLFGGEATVQWASGARPPIALGRWGWHLTWPQGVRLAWRLEALSGPLSGATTVAVGLSDLQVSDLLLSGRLESLPPGVAMFDLLHPAGGVQLQADAVRVDRDGGHGHGSVHWQEGQVATVPLAPLGSWRADWDLEGREMQFRVRTEQGPLHVDGQGRLGVDGRLGVQARAWSDPGGQAALAPVLQLLGRPEPDGSVALLVPWPIP